MRDLKTDIGGTDIYLLDQILKERYTANQIILDAGCGSGRNLKWFYKNGVEIYGVDADSQKIETSKINYPKKLNNFSVEQIDNLSFKDGFFHHIICNAVLHFAVNEDHFFKMISELIRILKPNGSLFVRIASNISLEKKVQHLQEGVYKIPDGTKRFLLTKTLLEKMMKKHSLEFIEPLKTVNVNDKRGMSTLVLKKPLL